MSGLNNYYSDYGSGTSGSTGSSTNSSSTWPSQGTWSSQTNLQQSRSNDQTPAIFQDLVMGRCTLEDIMKEFQMNGSDSPYTPDEDRIWGNSAASGLTGMGPSSAYLRQKSWPAPERSPAPPLPRPAAADWLSSVDFTPKEFQATSTPIEEVSDSSTCVTAEQLRVLSALPDAALHALLQRLQRLQRAGGRRPATECRFCKNNGERECYYRSHALKDGAGRVSCPVLRAFTCARCGASGDRAHTIKYCPLSTADERMKSSAIMRSVRLASGRRRAPPAPCPPCGPRVDAGDADAYGCYSASSPLDPLWAALEQKLML